MQMKSGSIMFEYIKLQRTICFGTCPVYSVTVDNEGNVNYYGELLIITDCRELNTGSLLVAQGLRIILKSQIVIEWVL